MKIHFTYPVHMTSLTGPVLHHNQIFDVAIEKSDYDIKNLIVL